MKSWIKEQYTLLCAFVLTALDFVIAVLTSNMAYLSNDDGSIQSALSGASLGEPYPFHQFINVLLGYPLAGLYRIFPGIQWWYVWSMALMAVGIFLIHFCLLKMAGQNRYSLPVVLGILLFLDVGFFVYPIANISFTIVPAVLGTGLVALWLYLAEAEEVRREKLFFVLTVVGYALLFCHRRSTGLALLCFILLAFLYYFVTRRENWKKAIGRFLVTAVIFLAVSGVLTTVNRTIQNNHNGGAFVEFNSARSQYMDYPHDTYEENPELFAYVGWDRDTYYLVGNWCFIPDEVTAENLTYITENSEYTTASTSVRSILSDIYHSTSCMSILLLYAASGLMALFLVILRFHRKRFWFLLLNNVGAMGLFAYQVLTGRAIYRSIFVFLLPAVVINLMLSFRQELDGKGLRRGFYVLTLVLGLICVVPMLTATFNPKQAASVERMKETQRAVDAYYAAHAENFYVTQVGTTNNVDPGRFPNGVTNSISWGGSTYRSDLFYKELEENDISELTGETFKGDNVYLICTTNAMAESYYDDPNGKDCLAMFYRYLKENYDAVGFVQTDKIVDGTWVYHFVFEDNADEYEEYYDLVDGYTVLAE